MKPAIRKNLSGILEIDEPMLDVFFSSFKPVSYSKGDYFVREGQVSRYVAYIQQGLLMCVYNRDGRELIDEFSMENEFISDYRSFTMGAPADKDIICIEDSHLLVIGYERMQELYQKYPAMERAGRLLVEMLLFNWQDRVKSLLLDDAETRYRKLITQRPVLAQRVPQYLLAQYLGLSPETLSRIRKQILS